MSEIPTAKPGATSYAVERIGSAEGFLALEGEWNRLAGNFPSPLLRHEWFAAAAHGFLAHSELVIFVARGADGCMHAIAPLVLEREANFPRLRLLGHQAREPAGFLYDEAGALEAVTSTAMRQGSPVEFRRLPRAEMRALAGTHGKRAWRLAQTGHSFSTWARLEKSAEALEARLSPGRLREFKRKRKQADKEGACAFEAMVPTRATVNTHLDRLFEVEGSGWKGRANTAILADRAMRAFCTRYAETAAERGTLRFFFLTIGGETAAAIMAVEQAKRLWELKIGYCERLSRCSPGLILAHETLKHASDLGLEAYEFLGGSENWQERWPHGAHAYSSFRTFPLTPGGAYFLAKDMGAVLARRMRGVVARQGRAGLDALKTLTGGKPQARRDAGQKALV